MTEKKIKVGSVIGIIGNRDYPNKEDIINFVNSLPESMLIVTGRSKNVCKWVAEAAKKKEHDCVVKKLTKIVPKKDFMRAIDLLNTEIAEQVDFLIAFVCRDYGTTYRVLRKAMDNGKPVFIRDSRYKRMAGEKK